MQAPTTPASINLADGTTRVIRFSGSALKTLKKEFGIDPKKDSPKEMTDKIETDQMTRVLAIGLDHKWDDGFPGVTADQLEDLAEPLTALRPLLEALGCRFTDPGKNAAAAPAPEPKPALVT